MDYLSYKWVSKEQIVKANGIRYPVSECALVRSGQVKLFVQNSRAPTSKRHLRIISTKEKVAEMIADLLDRLGCVWPHLCFHLSLSCNKEALTGL
jgi:hypothetical protein